MSIKTIGAAVVGAAAIGLSVGVASAEAFSIFNDRATFQTQLGNSITDDYESAGYQAGDILNNSFFDIFSNPAMSNVLGETKYQTTTPFDTTSGGNGYNIVYSPSANNRAYCAGCNGSFILDFTQTSVGSTLGVFGVGLDILFNDFPLYSAFVTFGDEGTQNFALSPGSQFFGITDNRLIKSIYFGLNGSSTIQGNFVIDNLTIGSSTPTPPVPTPALLPGLLGLGAAALRKRKSEASETEAEPIEV